MSEWWEATRHRRLVLQRCDDCGAFQHYPRALCVMCGSSELSFMESQGVGVVDSFTVVHRADEPYILARVRLAEGPILLTHLDGVAEPRCDMPVLLAWRPLPDGRHLPVFRSADGL
ncbi:Zn-ribbon domain-containing OB-fold protein [Actinoplanes sp. CA-054009]